MYKLIYERNIAQKQTKNNTTVIEYAYNFRDSKHIEQ